MLAATKISIIILTITYHGCSSRWSCEPRESGKIEKCDLKNPQQPCNCIARYISHTEANMPPKQTFSDQCNVAPLWIEYGRIAADEDKKTVQIELGVTKKPKTFTEALTKFTDWNKAVDKRSHYVINHLRQTFCTKYPVDLKDDFVYTFKYGPVRKESRLIKPIKGENCIHFQLGVHVNCVANKSHPNPSLDYDFKIKFNHYTDICMSDYQLVHFQIGCTLEWLDNGMVNENELVKGKSREGCLYGRF